MKIDPRSDSIALHYTGNEAGEPAISGVPARDLTENDVARLVFVEHGDIRGAARQAAIDKKVDELASGPYRKTAPTSGKTSVPRGTSKPTKAAAPAAKTQPASPAPVATPPPTEPSVDSTEGARA